MERLLAVAIERRQRTVAGLVLLFEIRVRVWVWVGGGGEGGWGIEGVAVVEGGEVARGNEGEWVWVLAGELGEKHEGGGF